MGFEDLDDLSELDEIPPFEEDLDVPGFDDSGDGGISRTFKIVGAILVLAVVGIVILLVVFALGGGDDLTDNDKTSTAVIKTNTAVAVDLSMSQTAVEVAILATEEYIQTAEAHATLTQIAVQTSEAQAATEAAMTAEAEAALAMTAEADAAATEAALQEALNMTETAVAIENTLVGRLVGRDGVPASGVTIQLYRDDGNGEFNLPSAGDEAPAGEDEAPATVPQGTDPEEFVSPPEGDAPANDAAGTDSPPADLTGDAIGYGDSVTGDLVAEEVDSYVFAGEQNDVLVITIEPASEVDMVARLADSGDSTVAEASSQPGDRTVILTAVLPSSGQFVVEVRSMAPTGYEMMLDGASAMNDGDTSFVPGGGAGVPLGPVDSLAQDGGDETPQPQPQQGDGDIYVGQVTTDDLGSFDFGALEPGVYFLAVAYEDLPESLQALIFPPTDLVTIMVDVPVSGEVAFTLGSEPTATPDPLFFDQTATALAERTPTATSEGDVTEVPGDDLTPMVTPTLEMPSTGIFSDGDGNVDSSSGLTILAIAAIGLVAVVFVARKLRTSA